MRSWKTKAVLSSLQGKGQQGDINQNVSPCIGYVSPIEIELLPPAWAYDSVIGVFSEPQGYDDAVLRVFMPEPLGTYDNRT